MRTGARHGPLIASRILAEWDHPGERPIALWAYDFGLKPAPYPKLWSWPRPIRTEAEAVYRLIERGELAPCRFNGTVSIASEMQEIASRWELLIRCPHLGYSGEVPAWFRRRHGKRILAEQAADAARVARTRLGRPHGANTNMSGV